MKSLALLAVALLGLSTTDLSLAAAPAAGLVVKAPWVRTPPPGADVAAAYFELHNPSSEPAVVVGVESPLAAHAMLHETTVEAGQSRMRPRERVTVAPGRTVRFEPGGLHVMLHGLARRPAAGETVPLVLLLEDGQKLSVAAQVRPLGTP